MRKALALTLLAALLVLLTVPTSSPALTPTSTEKSVVSLINKERARRGLAKVKSTSSLIKAARAHATDMAKRRKLTHYSSNDYSIARRLCYYGYSTSGCYYWSVGENIARARKGTSSATPKAIMASWMGSSAHRKVILRSVFRNVGVGVRTGSDGRLYFTLDMGRRRY